MKILVGFSRIFVGILFLFSGFVKLNDPMGFSYKLQEYFAEGVLNLEFLIPFALLMAVFLVIFEIIVGVTLLLGYLPKFTVWSLLLMIVFFTFLTFYSAYFNKVTDCGCFGDALPLTPWESFTKDIILLVLILVLFFGRKYITPILPVASHKWIIFLCFTVCLGFAYHVLMHMPAIDFRAYKVGVNIQEGMTVPEGAPEAKFAYHWKFDVNGEEKIVTTNGDYPTIDGKFIEVNTETIEEGYIPPIHDFAIEKGDKDYTAQFLGADHVIAIVTYNLSKSEAEGMNEIKEFSDNAMAKGYEVIGLTASSANKISQIKELYNLDYDFYTTDETALKTILRSNPGIVMLEKGTITHKSHWNDINDIDLVKVGAPKPKINTLLKRQLDSIFELDQKGRMGDSIDWAAQKLIDSSNTEFVEKVFKEHGYPGKSLVGEPTNKAAWFVIQHSNKIEKYLPLIKEAGNKGELDGVSIAMMEDRYLMQNGKAQVYGTQGKSFPDKKGTTIKLIWPIKDAENVNKRRKEAGFTEDVEVYAKRLYGEDFEYKKYTIEEVSNLENKTN